MKQIIISLSANQIKTLRANALTVNSTSIMLMDINEPQANIIIKMFLN